MFRFMRLAAPFCALLALTACDQSEKHQVVQDGKPNAPIAQDFGTGEKPAATESSDGPEPDAPGDVPADLPQPSRRFDFYVLALSWSPSYCAAEGSSANGQQCSPRRRYAFVVHGLWPQFERGFPTDCKTDIERVPDETVRGLYDIMPSAGLIGHEWRRHGACTGFSVDDFFATLRAARSRIAIPAAYADPAASRTVDPEDVEAAFIEANPDLPPDGISTSCDKRFLREVRICLTKQLEFRDCPELERRSCKAAAVDMPPVPGG